MPRGYPTKTPERVAEARRLRQRGMYLRDIAARFDVAITTVDAWLNDPEGHAARSRKDSYRGTCSDCGAATSGANGAAAASKTCIQCARTKNEDRNQALVAMWSDGRSVPGIASRLGMTHRAVYVWVERNRVAGKPIPRRRLSGSRVESRDRKARLALLYNAGLPKHEIAERLGYKNLDSLDNALWRLRRDGVSLTSRESTAIQVAA